MFDLPSDSVDKDTNKQGMKTRRKHSLNTQVSPRNIRIAVMGQDGVGKTGTVKNFGQFILEIEIFTVTWFKMKRRCRRGKFARYFKQTTQNCWLLQTT